MNKRKKGRQHELAVAKFLENQGFLVEVSKPVARWMNGKIVSAVSDFFGVADIIALERGTGKVWLIQVTADCHTTRKLGNFRKLDVPDGCKVLVQLKKRGGRNYYVFKDMSNNVFMVMNSKGEIVEKY